MNIFPCAYYSDCVKRDHQNEIHIIQQEVKNGLYRMQVFSLGAFPGDERCSVGNISFCHLDREDDDFEPDYEAMSQDREERSWL